MALEIGRGEIAWRLLLTVIAGALVGINRESHARPAGLRTTLLVCLAASVSMIQLNLLLPIRGKAEDSFVVMDLMRLPLGILSGMGFIGAGAILRKDNLVLGVTTAATLWFVTVVGLCLGGGQTGLGMTALALGLGVLWLLKPIEKATRQQRKAHLTIVQSRGYPEELDVSRTIVSAGYQISKLSLALDATTGARELNYELKWHASENEIEPPKFVSELAAQKNAVKISWLP